ncbi:MAG TPA: site-specific DNA-methyltransferase [Actinomycetaceae bacterium]|nr:site-specific DNA-methyltransferase [Actinomycetaceae bacterium]
MSAPYYQDEHLTLHHGDALDVLRRMDAGSVDCIVTSPPYYGLRDYGVDGQLGAEASPAEYVENMRALFAEARRVLADDGTLWLNLGDSYSGYHGNKRVGDGPAPSDKPGYRENMRISLPGGVPPKNLLGIPWRVAFALQDDGWILRNDIIWHKPNAMPESVTDRLSTRHEHLFLFSKSRRYWFDLDAIRVPPGESRNPAAVSPRKYGHIQMGKGSINTDGWNAGPVNPGDVWTIPTVPFPGAHFAVFPPALAERCILAGGKPGGTVLDPFSGSGTTGLAAAKHGRRYVGIDLNADYLDLSLRTRLQQPGLDLEGIA